MTFFGQFFDHGLDLVTKGGNGTVYIPLQPDDPLIATGRTASSAPATTVPAHICAFMALTACQRSTPTAMPKTPRRRSSTRTRPTPRIASHQVFLREYAMDRRRDDDGRRPGTLLDGATARRSVNGGIATWGEIKAQALDDARHQARRFRRAQRAAAATDPYGNFIPGANGFAQ